MLFYIVTCVGKLKTRRFSCLEKRYEVRKCREGERERKIDREVDIRAETHRDGADIWTDRQTNESVFCLCCHLKMSMIHTIHSLLWILFF